MNVKYKKYIDYIAKDIELPYLKSLEEYGLKQGEMNMVLSELYNQPVTIKGISVYRSVYDSNDNKIYSENSDGDWEKYQYDTNGNETYYENSSGYWEKREYNSNGNETYYETSDGEIEDNR
jgi:hypothetical protein